MGRAASRRMIRPAFRRHFKVTQRVCGGVEIHRAVGIRHRSRCTIHDIAHGMIRCKPYEELRRVKSHAGTL